MKEILCIKDFYMDSGEIAFVKGKKYKVVHEDKYCLNVESEVCDKHGIDTFKEEWTRIYFTQDLNYFEGGNQMNKMKEVAALLGVELGEEFRIKGGECIYKLTDIGLRGRSNNISEYAEETFSGTLNKILIGELEIEWAPKEGEKVWFPHPETTDGIMMVRKADKHFIELMRKRVGIYRTEEEALAKAKLLWGE